MAEGRPVAGRPAWLAYSAGGAASEVAAIAGARLVSSPVELRASLEHERPRLVLLGSPPGDLADIEMVAAARLRRPSLRAILIAPADASQARLAALERGFDEALPDTIPVDELVRRAELLLRRASTRHGRTIGIGDRGELDLIAHELRRDGLPVHLRPKEYRLLALLALNPGRAFTRRQLLDRVWGPGHSADSRTVDVHVRWLRSKLESDPERPVHLVTVRGTGYRLDPPGLLTG
jgi:DNA-binding response OmpR family regulator